MRQFFKIFLATLLALIAFCLLFVFVLVGWAGSIAGTAKPERGENAVLFIDMTKVFMEQEVENPLAGIGASDQYNMPGLYDAVRLIRYAKTDDAVKGIYLKCNSNVNGLATTDELRDALLDFKKSKKFIYAYGDVISQRAYYVASAADKIYCNPKGGIDWKGFSIEYLFFKNTLDKLEINPQIFYAGKFKSATEPFRTDHMTDANRLQSQVLLNDLYNRFLAETAASRNTDTAVLHRCANELLIRTAADAVRYKLADGTRYDDEVKDELREKLGIDHNAKINFIAIDKYARAVDGIDGSGTDKIALVYAQGDIVDGKGEKKEIGGDTYRAMIQKVRNDSSVKAIVVRVNSGGGSALASENIWHELSVARKTKPVVLSFGDYAASGGYYMSCGADSIFTQSNTLTGSIGVFSIIPNMKNFFNNKLGITFDGVKTGAYADLPNAGRPLTDAEKRFLQEDVDSIYQTFLERVAAGRKMQVADVDSIAQGRVWTGARAVKLGLADRVGGLQDAVECAARMARLKTYRIREYPEPLSWWEMIFGGYKSTAKAGAVEETLGAEGYRLYQSLKNLSKMMGCSQARMPFQVQLDF